MAERFEGDSEQALEAALQEGNPPPERVQEVLAARKKRPGFILRISDFSKIVCLGETPTMEPFCFDFRDNPREPSVIWWDGGDWQRVAPNFEAFMALYEPVRNPFRPEDADRWQDFETQRIKAQAVLSRIKAESQGRRWRWLRPHQS